MSDDDMSVDTMVSTNAPNNRVRTSTVPPSHDADQIDRDVARCTWHLLSGTQRSRRLQIKNKHKKKMASLLRKKQRRLGSLLNITLVRSYEDSSIKDRLNYYQGYHDVASIFLSALGGGGPSQTFQEDADSVEYIAASLGLDLPSRVLAEVSKTHLRDALKSNFLQLQTALRLVLMPLIWYFDPEVHAHLVSVDMEPFFALSWIITWFSHDVRDTALVKRLFDAFLVGHPLLPVYVAVAMVCHPYNRMEVLSTEEDFAFIHQTLAGLPKNSSMVGWKYKVGDGYISGDDEHHEDGTATTDNMDASMISNAEELEQLDAADDEQFRRENVIAGPIQVGMSKSAKAPFQELIENALEYMRRIPPRSLLALSKRYFQEDALHPMIELAPSIRMLQSTPQWSLIPTSAADWVLKQRMTGKRLSRRDRRRRGRSRSRSRSESQDMNAKTRRATKEPEEKSKSSASDAKEIELYLQEKCGSLPVIACGYGGPGDDEIVARKRKRRRQVFMIAGVAVIAMVAATVVVTYRSPKPPAPEIQRDLRSTSTSDASTKRDQSGSPINSNERGSTVSEATIEADGSIERSNLSQARDGSNVGRMGVSVEATIEADSAIEYSQSRQHMSQSMGTRILATSAAKPEPQLMRSIPNVAKATVSPKLSLAMKGTEKITKAMTSPKLASAGKGAEKVTKAMTSPKLASAGMGADKITKAMTSSKFSSAMKGTQPVSQTAKGSVKSSVVRGKPNTESSGPKSQHTETAAARGTTKIHRDSDARVSLSGKRRGNILHNSARFFGGFLKQARRALQDDVMMNLRSTGRFLRRDLLIPVHRKFIVPAGRKLKEGVWVPTKKNFLLPARNLVLPIKKKLTEDLIPGARKKLTETIIPGSLGLLQENVLNPLTDDVLPAARELLSTRRSSSDPAKAGLTRKDIIDQMRRADLALKRAREAIKADNMLKEAGKALREDDFVL